MKAFRMEAAGVAGRDGRDDVAVVEVADDAAARHAVRPVQTGDVGADSTSSTGGRLRGFFLFSDCRRLCRCGVDMSRGS